MREKVTKVYGIGVNDANYAVEVIVKGVHKRCPFYQKWLGLITRCYSEAYQKRFPSYKGCRVAEDWLVFSNFKAWMEKQDWEGKVLDKDLLSSDSKIYSPDTCVLISNELNIFMTDSARSRGEYPIGVHWHKDCQKFASMCRNPFKNKQESLGYYFNPQEAHEAWRKRKHELALMYAEMQTDERVKQALSVRYSKEVWYNK